MTKAKWFVTGALFALMALALVIAPTPALAAKKDMAKIKSYITAVGAGSIFVADPEGGDDIEIMVDDSTKIHKNNDEGASIGDLAEGDKVKVKYNTETGLAKRIQAKSPKAHGVITELGADSVTIENADGVEVLVLVGEDTKITLNDETATLGDLATEQHAKAKYDPTTLIAKFIHASDAPDDDEE